MEISEKLALEIYTIEFFHIVALLLTLGFTYYIYLKTKKTALFNSFAVVVGMLCIWMLSKILKTVAPNEDLRWFFIVTQYFGIQFLGLSVIVFSVFLTKNRLMNKKLLLLLSICPIIGFLVVVSNPQHHFFYSYFDFYKDTFGFMFYPITAINYIYLFTGIFMLARKFTHQPQFKNHLLTARFFAAIILFAVFGNIYYLLVKLTDLPYIFPFPFFDFTPITSALALMLFILPAYKYRFLDLMPMAYRHIFEHMPDGIIFIKNGNYLHAPNKAFKTIVSDTFSHTTLSQFINNLQFVNPSDVEGFYRFVTTIKDENEFFLLQLYPQNSYKVYKETTHNRQTFLRFKNITKQIILINRFEKDQENLEIKKKNLEGMAETIKELAIIHAHNKVSQDVHDILGHSLTVVIGIADLAATTKEVENSKEKMNQMSELLSSSVSDLKSSLIGKSKLRHTTLIKAIETLDNDTIELDLTIQGQSRELNSLQTEALFRVCQEAMTNAIKHGKADNILINIRFKSDELELYIIDDGLGCVVINNGYGIKGMIRRIQEIGGKIVLGSDGERGFHIHITLPI